MKGKLRTDSWDPARLVLEDGELDVALVEALGFEPGSEPFIAEITVRVNPDRVGRSRLAQRSDSASE